MPQPGVVGHRLTRCLFCCFAQPSLFGASDGPGHSLIYYFGLEEGWEPSRVRSCGGMLMLKISIRHSGQSDCLPIAPERQLRVATEWRIYVPFCLLLRAWAPVFCRWRTRRGWPSCSASCITSGNTTGRQAAMLLVPACLCWLPWHTAFGPHSWAEHPIFSSWTKHPGCTVPHTASDLAACCCCSPRVTG